MQSAEITVNRPKSTCLSIFLMMNEHVAVYLPWQAIELSRAGQSISIEYNMLHGLNQANLKYLRLNNLAFVQF